MMKKIFAAVLMVMMMCGVSFAEGKTLVAYFSWGGTTKALAENIAEAGGFDIFRIRPAKEYTTDYDTVIDVAKKEQNRRARPKLAENVQDFGGYDTVFLGWPCWWGDMPMVVFTFLEANDFSGKRIIPFTTHGGSSWGRSLTSLKKEAPSAKIESSGLSVGGSASKSQVAKWLKGLGFSVKR